MRIWMIILFLTLGVAVNAQEVISEGKVYEVKGKAIFQDGVDITSSLLIEERDPIYKALKNQINDEKNVEKARKKLEKAAKNAEKAEKKALKDLKKKQKAQDNVNKAVRKFDQQEEKYQKLKNSGKLSPNDESKWLKKLNGYKHDLEKARTKLNRS
ncbi:MAG: hypothetical protein ABI263_10225 [Gelidibacter sp.]